LLLSPGGGTEEVAQPYTARYKRSDLLAPATSVFSIFKGSSGKKVFNMISRINQHRSFLYVVFYNTDFKIGEGVGKVKNYIGGNYE
jgi:hypothetical protein